MKRYMGHLIRSAEKKTEHFLTTQVREPGAPDYGAMKRDITEGKPTVYALAEAVAVYCSRESRYYHDPALLGAMNLAMDFVMGWQRENGALDYPMCNFLSSPDTAFCFKRLIAAWRLLEKYEPAGADPGVDALRGKYLTVMKKALYMIRDGGFHTPNHRWSITAALMQGAGLFGEEIPGLWERAQVYLAEGIDGNADGEYAERSTGNYNAVVNNSMIAMYEETGDRKYLGYVARNLHMMLTCIDPDDTVFTENSTRQDQGMVLYADPYFYQYLYMASLPEEEAGEYAKYQEEFDRAAHKLVRDNQGRGAKAPDCLYIIMNYDRMMEYSFRGCGFPAEYRKFYRDTGMFRVKNARYGYSVLQRNTGFLHVKFGDIPICVKLGESVCDNRYFLAEKVDITEDGCILKNHIYTQYYQPFGAYQGTADWWSMDHSKRELLRNSELTITIRITEEADGLRLAIRTEGLDRVPLRLHLCIPAGAVLENEHFRLQTEAGGWLILKDGMAQLQMHDRVIELGPGFGVHAFGGHYDEEEINTAGYTLFLNEYTPVEKTVYIRQKV